MFHKQRFLLQPAAAHASPVARVLPPSVPLTPAQQAQLPGGAGPQFLEVRDRQARLQVIALAAATWPDLEAAGTEWQRKYTEASRRGFKGATQQALQGRIWHGRPTLTVAEACERRVSQASP